MLFRRFFRYSPRRGIRKKSSKFIRCFYCMRNLSDHIVVKETGHEAYRVPIPKYHIVTYGYTFLNLQHTAFSRGTIYFLFFLAE